ncbi:MAG: PAS domain S-box protein, partial [Candidatus Cloacimonetes bacterium]|nr:PAS domain S-box protein [Candidatus Cloacimonadota bacterium]
PPDSKDNYLQGLKYFWETGTETALGKTVEMTVLKKKGIEFDIELSLSAVKIEKELNTIAIIRDITERKHAEQALQESEERYRSLQENIPLGIYRITRQGKFISANHSMVRILNYNSRDELLKPSRIQLYAFKDQQEIFFQEIESNSFVSNYEIQLLKKNGDIFWAEINARAIRDELGNIIYYDGILEDITLQKQAKEELRQSKERLDIILQNIGNGVMVLDSSQNVFITNSRTKELLGFDPNQKITPVLSAMLINCHNQGKPLLEAFNKKSFSNLELNVEFPLPRTLYVTGTTFTDVDGKSAGKIFILADVTKEKDIERLKTDFVSSVSHELRTPITSIMGFAQTMLRNKEINNDIREEFLGIIHRESKRLSNLIEDVLSISRIESGKIHYDMSEISLGPIIQEVFNIYKIQAEKKNLRISCNVEKNLPKINADKDAVHQIIVNFIGNAIKFTESGDSVTISLKKIDDWLCLEVSDTGLGIPKKDQARIFDKFYRVSRPGTEIPGTGLGLSIVKEIVELHGGKIEMESEEGKGTTFRTFFPLSKKTLQKTG